MYDRGTQKILLGDGQEGRQEIAAQNHAGTAAIDAGGEASEETKAERKQLILSLVGVSGIYAWTCKTTLRKYIGASCNIGERYMSHIRFAKKGKSRWERTLFTAGPMSFSFEVLERCQPEQLREREQDWLVKLQPFGVAGFNSMRRAFCKPTSEETRQLLSLRAKERFQRPIEKEKAAERVRNYFASSPQAREAARVRAKTQMGTPEARKANRERTMERLKDEKFRLTCAARLHAALNTPEGRAAQIARGKARWSSPEAKAIAYARFNSPESIRKRLLGIRSPEVTALKKIISCKPVLQIDARDGSTVASFPSLVSAEAATGIMSQRISSALHGRQKTAGGFRWEFVIEQASASAFPACLPQAPSPP